MESCGVNLCNILMGLDGTQYFMYPLLNNFDIGCTIFFYNSIINNFIFVIVLTLFSIYNAYDVPSKYILFPI